MKSQPEEFIVVRLNIPRSWAAFLMRLCLREAKSRERKATKGKFTPPEGKQNWHESRSAAFKVIAQEIREQTDLE